MANGPQNPGGADDDIDFGLAMQAMDDNTFKADAARAGRETRVPYYSSRYPKDRMEYMQPCDFKDIELYYTVKSAVHGGLNLPSALEAYIETAVERARQCRLLREKFLRIITGKDDEIIRITRGILDGLLERREIFPYKKDLSIDAFRIEVQ